MRGIKLTQEKIALVDDEDFEYLNQWKWCAQKSGYTYYAVRSTGRRPKRKLVRLHWLVLGYPPKGFECDHIDGNGLNNQRQNLRFVSHRQNTQNRHDNRSSKYPGVCWHKRDKIWLAKVRISDRQKYLGYFSTEEKAYNAYRKAVEDIGERIL